MSTRKAKQQKQKIKLLSELKALIPKNPSYLLNDCRISETFDIHWKFTINFVGFFVPTLECILSYIYVCIYTHI